MKQGVLKLYNGFGKTKAVLVALVVLVYIGVMMFSGGSLWQLLLLGAAILIYIMAPGAVLVRLLKVKKLTPEFAGALVPVLGSAVFTALFCIGMYVKANWIAQLILPAVSLVSLMLLFKKDGKIFTLPKKLKVTPQQWMLVLLWAALVLLYTFMSVVKNGRPLAIGDTLLSQDMMWNVGNANSFALGFPPQDIRYAGIQLKYHYYTELVEGALAYFTGIPAYNIVAFYMQPFMLGLLVLCLYRLGKVLWKDNGHKPLLFTYVHFLFACASLWKILPGGASRFMSAYIVHLITNSNAMTTGIILLCVFCALFKTVSDKKGKVGIVYTVLLLVVFALLALAKGPVAALVAIAVAVAALVGLLQRSAGWRNLSIAAGILCVFGASFLLMYSGGAGSSTHFSFTQTLRMGYFNSIMEMLQRISPVLMIISVPVLWIGQSFLTMPAQFSLYIWGVGKDLRRFKSLSQNRLFANAMAIGGLLAFFCTWHQASSQTYFLYAGIFFINMLAVDRVDDIKTLLQKGKTKWRTFMRRAVLVCITIFAAVGFITTTLLYVHHLGSGGRRLVWNMFPELKYSYEMVSKPEDERAALWLHAHASPDSVFATNRYYNTGNREGISNIYSAFSGRQGYMEGVQYAITNMGVPSDVVYHKLAVNEALFSPETLPEDVVQLCIENNIDYLLYSSQFDGDNTQMSAMELVFDDGTVQIYKLPDAI